MAEERPEIDARRKSFRITNPETGETTDEIPYNAPISVIVAECEAVGLDAYDALTRGRSH